MEEVKVGKWYKNEKWGRPERDFIKATKFFDGDAYFNEKIFDGTHSKTQGRWGKVETCVEAQPHEYSQFLPDGHPDKIDNNSKYTGRYVKINNGYFLLGKGHINGMYNVNSGERIDVHFDESENRLKVEMMPVGFVPSTINFKVGSWYKNIGGSNEYYVKFDSILGGIMYGEAISKNNKQFYNKTRITTIYSEAILMTDLTEIQEYLPNTHVDKIRGTIGEIGKWYGSDYGNSNVVRIKFNGWSKSFPDCPLLTEAIVNGKLIENYNNGGIYNSDFRRFMFPLDISLIQQYLPDGHPDKYISITPRNFNFLVPTYNLDNSKENISELKLIRPKKIQINLVD